MSAGWNLNFASKYGAIISVGCNDGFPYVAVEEYGGRSTDAVLPTDPVELKRLIEVILAAAGMQDMDQDWMPEPR